MLRGNSNPHLLEGSSLSAADCRKLDGSAAAEAYLDLLTADQDGHYALAIGQAHDLFDGFGVVFSTDFLIGHAALLEVLSGGSAVGAARLGVDNYLLRHGGNPPFLIQLIELLDDELHIAIAFVFPDSGLQELLISPGLGEVCPDQVKADDGAEPIGEAPDKLFGILASIEPCLLYLLFVFR